MFVVLLKYLKPLSEIEKHVGEHRAFLDEGYAKNLLLASGPQNPRTGGVLLARGESRAELEEFLARDPFTLKKLAEYSIIEFTPVKFSPAFEKCL